MCLTSWGVRELSGRSCSSIEGRCGSVVYCRSSGRGELGPEKLVIGRCAHSCGTSSTTVPHLIPPVLSSTGITSVESISSANTIYTGFLLSTPRTLQSPRKKNRSGKSGSGGRFRLPPLPSAAPAKPSPSTSSKNPVPAPAPLSLPRKSPSHKVPQPKLLKVLIDEGSWCYESGAKIKYNIF